MFGSSCCKTCACEPQEYAAEFTSDFHLTIGQLPWQEATRNVSLVFETQGSSTGRIGELQAENLLKSDIELLQLPIVWHCDKLVLMACDSSTEPLKPLECKQFVWGT